MTANATSRVYRPFAEVIRGAAQVQPLYTEGYAYGFDDVARGKPFDQGLMDRGPVDRPRWKDFKPVDQWTALDWSRFQEGYEHGRDRALSMKVMGFEPPVGWNPSQSWLPKYIEQAVVASGRVVNPFRIKGAARTDEADRVRSRRSVGCTVDLLPDDEETRVQTY